MHQDITDNIVRQEELRRERDFINAVLETSGGLVLVLDQQGQVVRFNRACEQATGYAFSEVRGRCFGDLFLLPEEAAAVQAVFHKLAAGEFPSEYENHWVARDGTRRLIAWSNTCLLSDVGQVEYVISTGIDITARKQFEQELQQRNQELAILNTVTSAVSSSLKLIEVFAILNTLLAEQLDVSGGALFLYDEGEDRLSLEASWGLPQDVVIALTTLPVRVAHNEAVIRTRDVLSIVDLQAFTLLEAVGLNHPHPEWHSYLGIPLVARGAIQGVVDLFSQSATAFSHEQVDFFKALGRHVGVAIQNARLFEQVREGHERLQVLSHRLLEGQEAERRHIARELHDEIGQALTAIKIKLQTAQQTSDAGGLADHLADSVSMVDRALQQARNLSRDLRPSILDDLGLVAALRWYVDRQARLAGFTAKFIPDLYEARLPPDLETVCFRVVQEALTNVVRHAHARRVRVALKQFDEHLHLVIQDDGVGFDVRAAQARAIRGVSMGLIGMRERVVFAGGAIEFVSQPGRGTEVRVDFPLHTSAGDQHLAERRVG